MAAGLLGITGDRKLLRTLAKFSAADQRRLVRRPMSAALTPINKAAKRNAPKDKKNLSKAIGKKVKVYPGVIWGAVGIRTGEKYSYIDEDGNVHKPANYGPLRERGTQHAAADPFLRPAFDQERAGAVRILGRKTWENIEKEARKS